VLPATVNWDIVLGWNASEAAARSLAGGVVKLGVRATKTARSGSEAAPVSRSRAEVLAKRQAAQR